MWQLYPEKMNVHAHSQEFPNFYLFEDLSVFETEKIKPKLHTIREDKANRWQTGMKIDFFINVRKKDMFRFAPVLPVVSVQEIIIFYDTDFAYSYNQPAVYINGSHITGAILLALAQNDGFDTVEEFFAYFNKDFKGKIIHWTNFQY